MTLKLVSWNIQYGVGLDGRYDLSRIPPVLQGADIIALQEVERCWDRTNHDDQPALLAEMMPDYYWVYGPAFDMDASSANPDGSINNQRRQFGPMLLSRYPIQWSRLHLLPLRRMVNPFNNQSAALEGLIETPWGPLRVLSLHLAHVGPRERLEQIDFLLERHRTIATQGGPWSGCEDGSQRNWTYGQKEPDCPQAAIWMGDFNSEPDSEEYRRVTGGSPYYEAPLYYDEFVDSTVAAGHDKNAFSSYRNFKADGSPYSHRLDYCHVSATLAACVSKMWIDEAETASDHQPVWTELSLDKDFLFQQ